MDMIVEELVAEGRSREEAEEEARRRLGDIELVLSPHTDPHAPLADPRTVRCIHTLAFEVPESEYEKLHREFEKEDPDIVDIDHKAFRSIIVSDPDGYCVELYYNKREGQR